MTDTTETKPEPTPIEQSAAWRIHRTAYVMARGNGCHWTCAQALAFAVAHTGDDPLPKELGQPCKACLGIWQAAKKQRSERAA